MSGIPSYARSGVDALLAQGLDDLGARVDLIAAQAPGGAAAFTTVFFTSASEPRPAATTVQWRGPVEPLNATDADTWIKT